MRKTSFFYSVKFILLIVLAWMLLLDEAVRLNMSYENQSAENTETEENTEEVGHTEASENTEEAGYTEAIENAEECVEEAGYTEAAGSDKMAGIVEELQSSDTVQGKGAENADGASSGGKELSEPSGEGEEVLHSVNEKKIRVLLMDTGYQSYFHPSVTLLYHDTEVTYTPDSPMLSDSSFLIPEQEGGITVTSIDRQEGNPVYQGSLEIKNTPEGLVLINEVPLETYLEAVVPSEMPSSYEAEALKAQAVCARTYAYRQMQEARLKEYGADVDDSVNFQVYGNIMPQESTTNAVKATQGQVLCQDGELIQAYYFSTSSGATSTDEIWGAQQPAPYLKAVSCAFDREEPWGSWTVTIPWEILSDRSAGYPVETDAGRADESNVSEGLKVLEITRKNQSNAVTGLHVVTEKGAFNLTEEYAIREFLSPKGCIITEKDGSITEGGSILPSAYFTMETVPGDSVVIHGRGYGHGVGMSQTAANQMALKGYDCEEILDYFFKDVELKQIE